MNWKDVIGYEGLYQVSECGQVKSIKNGLMKPCLTTHGYRLVNLCKDGKVKTFSVHRLVMYAFVGVREDMVVNHIDECRTNNHVSNLEYTTNSGNLRAWRDKDSDRYKRHTDNISKRNGYPVKDTITEMEFNSMSAAAKFLFSTDPSVSEGTWRERLRHSLCSNRFVLM